MLIQQLASVLLRLPQLLPMDGEILIPPDPSIASPSDAVDHLLLHIDFSRWISRVGGLVAFIGAIKFALSVKSEDAREQLQAALIMVSGFMIQAAIGNLGVFNMPDVYTDAAATQEFQSILDFIGGWSRRVGALAMLLGGAIFGFATKDSNPGAKVSGLKTMAAGGMTVAVSGILGTFVR